ncbi:MAG: hypothetical protein HC933_10505 [Pleurocapsa sp. SU_196_0]|nr:hypothetical protein [Pleurocapsa sp. SU_196_0]
MPALRAGFVPRQAARDTLETYGRVDRWLEDAGVKPFEALSLEPLAGLAPSTKLIWCFLASARGEVVAGNRSVALALGLSSKSVVDAMSQLEALGLVEIVDRGSGPKPRIVRALLPTSSRD